MLGKADIIVLDYLPGRAYSEHCRVNNVGRTRPYSKSSKVASHRRHVLVPDIGAEP